MNKIDGLMEKYLDEGIVGSVVKGIKAAAHEVAVRVREVVTQAAVENMSIKQLESKIAEWREYITKLKEKATADKKEGKDVSDHQKNYRAALQSLSMMEVQHDELKREERKKNPSKKEEDDDDGSNRLTPAEKRDFEARARKMKAQNAKLKTKLTGKSTPAEKKKLGDEYRRIRKEKG